MIDIHSHILPAIDDGPDTLEKSLTMAKIAVHEGIDTIVATPHSNNGVFNIHPDKILGEVRQLNKTLKEEKIPLTVLPGSDVHVNFNLLDDIKSRRVMTVNNGDRYIILELPSFGLPPNLSDFIWDLKLYGITPIFSHPERNEAIQENMDMLYDFIRQGALLQITAMSLTGEFGKKAEKCAVSLLKHNLAHVIATDSHSVRRRPPVLSKALKIAIKLVGTDNALRMVVGTPSNIINGEQVSAPEPVKMRNRLFALHK
ncbi:MAG: tyrosine protein phosphatase [Nitrospiraceae bacterium]|nr:MAG: tyrosine protein phosphatase [Nitrospiraceae bacterium]